MDPIDPPEPTDPPDSLMRPLARLRWHWGSAYDIRNPLPYVWIAERRDNRAALWADTSTAPHDAIRADYIERPTTSRGRYRATSARRVDLPCDVQDAADQECAPFSRSSVRPGYSAGPGARLAVRPRPWHEAEPRESPITRRAATPARR